MMASALQAAGIADYERIEFALFGAGDKLSKRDVGKNHRGHGWIHFVLPPDHDPEALVARLSPVVVPGVELRWGLAKVQPKPKEEIEALKQYEVRGRGGRAAYRTALGKVWYLSLFTLRRLIVICVEPAHSVRLELSHSLHEPAYLTFLCCCSAAPADQPGEAARAQAPQQAAQDPAAHCPTRGGHRDHRAADGR